METQFKNKRIGDIEFIYNEHNNQYELVKWYKNYYYGQQEKYERVSGDRYKITPYSYVVAGLFELSELCYAVGYWREDEEGFDFIFIGNRPYALDTTSDEINFFILAKEFTLKLNEQKLLESMEDD